MPVATCSVRIGRDVRSLKHDKALERLRLLRGFCFARSDGGCETYCGLPAYKHVGSLGLQAGNPQYARYERTLAPLRIVMAN